MPALGEKLMKMPQGVFASAGVTWPSFTSPKSQLICRWPSHTISL